MNALYQRKIIIDGQLTEANNVQTKVEQDIAFLQSRIALMQQHSSPNRVVIANYESMLNSRTAVLSWLRDGQSKQSMNRAS